MTTSLKNGLFLFLVIILGFALYSPFLDVLPYISEGDTGRDLYAFQMTMQGKTPYQDYFWNYGPLMPYYYALCFHIFGTKITSILLGRFFLTILSGALIYSSLRVFFRPIFCALGALWFWSFNPEYTYTFNHTGGTCLILWIIYCLVRRISDPGYKIDLQIGVAIFLLLLVKLNIGLAVAMVVILAYGIINAGHAGAPSNGKLDFPPKFLLVPLLAAGLVYFLLLKDVPSYVLSQSIPFLPGYEYKGSKGFLLEAFNTFAQLIWLNLTSKEFEFDFNGTSLFVRPWPFRLIMAIAVGSFIYLLSSKFFKNPFRKNAPKEGTTLLILLIFILVLSHEFMISAFDYRLQWCTPLATLAVFIMAGLAVEQKRRLLKIGLMIIISATIAWDINGRHLFRDTLRRMPGYFIASERGGVYVFNRPEWVQTLTLAVERIQATIPRQETFLVIPYNPIYYYLTDHPAPVPELIFFDRQHITEEQQQRIIADLERKGNKWIVLSNAAFPHGAAPGFGTFGQSYSRLLAQYWRENFVLVESIGDWEAPPEWISNNAIRIYRKK